MIGKVFGRLTVIERAGSDRQGNSMWLCACNCGGQTVVRGFGLRSGHTRSCGCLQREWSRSGRARMKNLVGQRFGRLVAVARVGRHDWLCRCDCGSETTAKTSKLTSGWTESCGHLASESLAARNRARRGKPNLARRSDSAGYNAAHQRTHRAKGRAADFACVDCGASAAHWSYDYRDPDERADADGRIYSLESQFYVARCVVCHKRFDMNHQKDLTQTA